MDCKWCGLPGQHKTKTDCISALRAGLRLPAPAKPQPYITWGTGTATASNVSFIGERGPEIRSDDDGDEGTTLAQ